MTRFSSMTASRRVKVVLALVLTLSSLSYFMQRMAQAADGDLDPAFGTFATDMRQPAGVARTFFGANSTASSDRANAIGIQSTGKIIAGGTTQPTAGGNSDFALARYTTAGLLDTTFGPGMTGKVTTDFTAGDNLNRIAIDTDDKIVAVGSVTGSMMCSFADTDWLIAKYNADGSLDTTFNAMGTTPGTVRIDFFGCADQAFSVVIQPDHKIVVGGLADQVVGMSFTSYSVLVRLNSNGTFDSTFNGGVMANTSGKVLNSQTTTSLTFPLDMALIPSGMQAGKLITVGSFGNDFQVDRFNSDGSLDATFGTAGKATTNLGTASQAKSVALQPDGKIVAGGVEGSPASFAMARYDTGGILDPMFGTGGKVTTTFPAPIGSATALSVGVMSTGKIVLSGTAQGTVGNPMNDVALARYSSGGILDTTFGTMGLVFTHFGQNPNGGGMGIPEDNQTDPNNAGILQSDNKILVAGAISTSFASSDVDFFVARFQNTGLDCTLTCPANITNKPNDQDQCGAVVTYSNATESGTQCGGTIICSPASGSFFPVGTTTVTCSDSAGPSCQFTVQVNDTQNPTITCPANITAQKDQMCGKVVTYTTPTPSDNCPNPTASCLPASGSCFAVGTTTVTCTAKDAATNMASCNFTVTVSDCTITCPANQTGTTGPGATQCCGVVNYPAPTTTGSCGTVTCSPASGTCFPVGTTTVTCTTAAGPGCSFTVTVTDNTPPVITCPGDINAAAVASCPIATTSGPVIFMVTATDNCPGVIAVCNPPSGSAFPVGTTTVACKATDASGNMATCTFNINVFSFCLQDDTNPGNVVLVNASTGDFFFCCGGVPIASGRGTLTTHGCIGSIDAFKGNRQVHIQWDTSANNSTGAGTAYVQKLSNKTVCQITDKNMSNNTCQCSGAPPPASPTKPPKGTRGK